MQVFSATVGIILAAYIVWQVVEFVPRYRRLKQAIADGDPHARTNVYKRAIIFEWVSALLALIALRFDWSRLNPSFLGAAAWIRQFTYGRDFDRGRLIGVFAGLALGTAGIIIARLRANRRAPASATPRVPWLQKLLPDFSALIPVTMQERILWVVVALSAGVCEEVVFRGWLLATLHTPLGFTGVALIIAASLLFGAAHAYQGISGVVLTSLAGAFFCAVYVASGSLLLPILLHALVDVRFAILPAPPLPKTATLLGPQPLPRN